MKTKDGPMNIHPNDETLIAFAAGESMAGMAASAAHVRACARCAALVADFHAVRDLVRIDSMVEVPQTTLARAGAIIRAPRPLARPVTRPAAVPFRRFRLSSLAAALVLGLIALSLLTVGASAAASSNALPGEPLYPVKTTLEQIQVSITTDPYERAQLSLILSQRRLSEIQDLAAKGKYRGIAQSATALEESLEGDLSNLDALSEKDPNKSAVLAEKADETLSKSSTVLNDLLTTVPEEARPAISHAIEVSDKGKEAAKEHSRKPQSVPPASAVPTPTPTVTVAPERPAPPGNGNPGGQPDRTPPGQGKPKKP